jgi:hypothetical protein
MVLSFAIAASPCSAVILRSESRGTHDHILSSDSRLRQPGGPGPTIYIPQEQGDPIIPPGTGFLQSYVPTDGQSASLSWDKHPPGTYDHNFITVRQLWVCWCGTLSLRRGRVCRLQLLQDVASVVILRSESRGTHDHILLSQIPDFRFCRLLWLAGLRWRYSTPPPHGMVPSILLVLVI